MAVTDISNWVLLLVSEFEVKVHVLLHVTCSFYVHVDLVSAIATAFFNASLAAFASVSAT